MVVARPVAAATVVERAAATVVETSERAAATVAKAAARAVAVTAAAREGLTPQTATFPAGPRRKRGMGKVILIYYYSSYFGFCVGCLLSFCGSIGWLVGI